MAYDEDTNKLLPVKEMPITIRRVVSGVEEDEKYDREGNVTSVTRKIKLWSKTDAASTLIKIFMETAEAKKRLLEAVDDEELQARAQEILAKKSKKTELVVQDEP